MAEIDQRAGVEADTFLGAHLGDAVLAPVQRATPRRQPVRGLPIEGVVALADGAAEEQPRLLEALADRGDEEVEAANLEPELGAGQGVVDAEAGGMGIAVAGIDDAAREHPGAAGVVGAVGPAGEKDLDAARAGAVADNDDGRGGPRRPLRCRLGSGRREGRGVGGRSAHRRSAGADKGRFECGTEPRRRWLPSATSDSAALVPPTARPPCCLSRRAAGAAKMTSIAAAIFNATAANNQEFIPCFTMPSFSS